MATQFSVPKSPSKSIFQMNYFQGCDFTNSAANVDDYKSPNCVNMVRDVPGKIRKSMGYKTQFTYPGKINGSHFLRDSNEQLIHAGTGIYHNNVLLYNTANNARSRAWQFDDKLYIQDGKELLVHECKKGSDADLAYTRGEHKVNEIGITYTEDMKLKANAKVDFHWTLPIRSFDVTYGTTTTNVYLDDDGLKDYTWTNNLGEHDFKFKFYAVYDEEEYSTPNGSFVIKLGSGATISFTGIQGTNRPLEYFYVDWVDEDDNSHRESVSNYVWENTKGNYQFTFSWSLVKSRNVSNQLGYTTSSLSLYLWEGDTIVFPDSVANNYTYKCFYYAKFNSSGSEVIVNGSKSFTATTNGNVTFKLIWGKYGGAGKTISIDTSDSKTWLKGLSEADAIVRYQSDVKITGYRIYYSSGGNQYYALNSTNLSTGDFRDNNIISITFYLEKQGVVSISRGGLVTKTLAITDNSVPSLTSTISNASSVESELHYIVGNTLTTEGFINNLDGTYLDEEGYYRTIKKVRDNAYIPTVTIGKEPSGGGTSKEDLNLLQPYFIETFYGSTAEGTTSKTFQLSFKKLTDASKTKAWILNSSGDWVQKTYGTDFTVNATTGVVTFGTAPGNPPDRQTPNVKIQAYRVVDGYADRINKCTFSTLFGVNGNPNRLFVSGNSKYPNYDWYSQYNDPTYFPDTGYSVLGSSSSAIVGYSVINNYLAAHKDDKERDMNIILREGNLVDNEPAFPVVATLQGAGAVATWSFGYLETEPMFLTKRGIYAVTAQDITGEKYAQNRSYYIDGKLLEEPNLDQAYACIYNDFYVLALNGKLYILDGLQPIQTDKSMPYATRQYACFYRENVPATCIWTFNDELYFGTADGKVCKFYKDKDDLYSYNDDGEPICCVWETPDLDGKYFFKNKTFRYIAIRLDSAIATSINIFTMKRGIWSLAKTDSTKARYFTFPYLNFAKFSFSTDTTQKIVHTKLRLKKVDKARFRFTNTEVNEPFGLFDVALEYIENGNYKN